MEKLKEFWETKVPKEHKHFVSEMSEGKKSRQIDHFLGNVIGKLENKDKITALDWGCGGGLLANEMTKAFKKVYVTDISDESIKEAIKYCENNVDGIINPYNGHDWHKFDIDLIVAYAVIWHMPGLQFFKNTLDIWAEEIKPEYIALQNKGLSGAKSFSMTEEEYFYYNNYLEGLRINKEVVVSLFEKKYYYCIHKSISKTEQGLLLEHFLFKRKIPINKGGMGKHCKIIYDEKFKMGKGSTYNDYFWCNARGGVTIGENTLMGPHVTIVSTNHVIKGADVVQNATSKDSWNHGDASKRIEYKPVTIGDDVWIGAGCTILAGANIPDKCVIGAGTVITEKNSKGIKGGDIVVPDTKLRTINNRVNYS